MQGAHDRPADTSNTVGDFVEMAAAQRDNPDLERLIESSLLIFRDVPLPAADRIIVCDVCTLIPQPYVRTSFHRIVFDSLYSLSLPEIRVMQRW